MLNIVPVYIKKHWLIYSLLLIYFILLLLNSLGIGIWLPSCLITEATGYSCFGCGLNTAAIYLLQLEFRQAFEANPLIYPYVLLFISWISYDFYKFKGKH